MDKLEEVLGERNRKMQEIKTTIDTLKRAGDAVEAIDKDRLGVNSDDFEQDPYNTTIKLIARMIELSKMDGAIDGKG